MPPTSGTSASSLNYFNFWVKGLGVTLAYSVGTVLGGLIIGVICGMLLLYRRNAG